MNTVVDETWATAAPLSVAQVREIKARLLAVLETESRKLPPASKALLTEDLIDIIGTLEVERFHLAQGALRANMLRRELEQGGASEEVLTLLDTVFMEWALYAKDRAAGQPNPVSRLVSLVIQHEDRAARYKSQLEAQAAEIAKLRAQNAQLHEALERAAAPQRMYTYGQPRGVAANSAAERVPAPDGHGRRNAGPAGLGATAPSPRGGEPGPRRGNASRGSAGLPVQQEAAAANTGAGALLQWLTAPVATGQPTK